MDPIELEIVAAIPRKVLAGDVYDVTIDVKHDGGRWPYDREEQTLHCIAGGSPGMSVAPVGSESMVLHRFGGTYGPVTYQVVADGTTASCHLVVKLINSAGVTLGRVQLADVVVEVPRVPDPLRSQTVVTWARADVVILTAIELEYAAVKLVEAGAATGSRWIEEKHDGLPVALREFVGNGGRRLRIVVGRAPDMGKGSALTTLLPLVDALRPLCIAMCGVCAGRPGKTALGDVVVGERLYDYDTGKWTELGLEADVRAYSLPAPWKIALEQFQPKSRFGGEDWWQRRPVPYEWQEAWVLAMLHQGVDNPVALPESKDRCPQWSFVIENLWAAGDVKRNTLSITAKGRNRATRVAIQYPQFPDMSPGGEFMPFQLHVAPIGSGSAVREDVEVWGFLTPHMRKNLALEMEASALAEVVRARAHRDPIEAVVMKGVMDFANHGRDDHFKDYAARASAECLIAFLRDQLAGAAAVGDVATAAGTALPDGGIDARINETRQQVASALGGRDQVVAALVASIGCRTDELVDRLVMRMSAAELVEHWHVVSRGLSASPDGQRDVDALCSILLTVLPYLADWRQDLAAGLASGDGSRVIVPRFTTVAVAEAIMAGLHGRQCEFVHHPEIGPCGVAMVHVPAVHQTALFKSRDRSRLIEDVIAQLAQQLGVVRSGRPDLDRHRVNAALRVRAMGYHGKPRRYYFVYRDEAAANLAEAGAEWELALTALGDPQGVPRLALIRMQGQHSDAELAVERLLADVLLPSPPESASWAVAGGRDRYGLWAAFEVDGVQQRLRWIPPGRFLMGSPPTEAGRWEDEGPQRWVTITKGYWLGETPVTQALWRAVMKSNPSHFVSDDRPVEQVSWDDCGEFIERLNRSLDGLVTRLPSEAEWERACRAGTTAATWVGDLTLRGEHDAPELDAIAWYGGNSGVGFDLDNGYHSSDWPEKQHPHARAGTRPVGQRHANPYGLHDILGNVYEWCQDAAKGWKEPYPYASEPAVDPVSPDAGSSRVYRGGSWLSYARYVRAAIRDAFERSSRYDSLGFRLAGGQESAPSPLAGAPRSGDAPPKTKPARPATPPKPAKKKDA